MTDLTTPPPNSVMSEWLAWSPGQPKTIDGAARLKATSWSHARVIAAVRLGCEPEQVTLEGPFEVKEVKS
jgi:hypothetical protein